jgi:hypothetical protein
VNNKLPYTKTTTFAYAGEIYPDETSALRAAIVGVTGNPGIATTIVNNCCALAPLLARACDLGMGSQPPQLARDE